MKWLLLFLFFAPVLSQGQDSIPNHFAFNGYLTNMESFSFQEFNNKWDADNQFHNRLNFKWFNASNTLSAAFEMRNRLITGYSLENVPGYAAFIEQDNGLVTLTRNVASGNAYLFNAKIDRLYFDYTRNKLQIRLGRQRINWGQCLVWNPNDIFNAYSFFDFDYPEKPGSDAFRLEYYVTSTSALEFAVKANHAHQITSAALFRFNKFNYDFQLLAGLFNSHNYVVGAGWSGNIKNAAFTGEISYFKPINQRSDTVATLVVSLGSQYLFANSLMLQAEVLYNQNPISVNSFSDFYATDQSAKNLSISKTSLFLQATYPATPLLNLTLATIYYPNLKSYFIGPSISYSLATNLEAALFTQTFASNITPEATQYYNLIFLRLKYNF